MLNNALFKILALLIISLSNAYSENRFALPANKRSTVNCQEAVQASHQGKINSEKIVYLSADNYEIHFEITDKAGVDWLMVCDGKSGKILRSIQLDNIN